MRRRTSFLLGCNSKVQNNRNHSILSSSAAESLELDFLNPRFGYFSRSLPPISQILNFSPPKSYHKSRSTATGLGRLTGLSKSRGDCICGRVISSCLRCRPSSSLATTSTLVDPIEILDIPIQNPIPNLLSDPQFKLGGATPRTASLKELYDKLHSTLPSVRTHLDTKRQLPKSRKPFSPLAKPPTTWTLPLLESTGDTLWTGLHLTPTSSRMKKFTIVEELDLIRIFSRLVRAYPYIPSITAISTNEEITQIEKESYQFQKFRILQGQRITFLLSRLEARNVTEHARSRATLYLDSIALQDLLPPLSLSAPDASTKDPFEAALVTIFLSPSSSDSKKEKSLLQAKLSTLSILIEAWSRSTQGPAEALKLLVNWRIEESLDLKVEEAVKTFSTVLVKSHGELLGRLQPSPSSWFNEKVVEKERRRVGLHLIYYLSVSGSAIEGLRIWKALRRAEVGLSEAEGVESGVVLLEGLARSGEIEEAINLLKELNFEELLSSERTGEQLKVRAYQVAAKVLAQRGDFEKVDNYFRKIEKIQEKATGLERIARIMRAQAESGSVLAVRKLFDSEETQTLMGKSSFEDQGRLYGELIRAHVKVDDILSGMESLERMILMGLRPTLEIINSLLFGFANKSELNRTYALFSRLQSFGYEPDLVSYNALLTLHANLRDPESALKVMNDLPLLGLKPDLKSWTTLMNAFVEVGSWNKAIDIFQFLESNKDPSLKPDIAATNVLLKANVLLATPAQTILALFRRTLLTGLKPNSQTYTLVMQSLCTAGMMDAAESLFTSMDSREQEDLLDLPPSMNIIEPDAFIFSILIRGYLAKDDTIKARACLNEMKARGISPSSITYGIIVGSFLKGNTVGGVRSARALAKDFLDSSPLEGTKFTRLTKFDKPLARGQELLNVFGPIINSYAKKLDASLAMEYFRQLLKEDVTPTIPLYTSLMDAYRGVQQLDSVQYLWNHIHQLVLTTYPAKPVVIKPTFPPTEDPILVKIDSDHQNILCLPFSIYIDALAAANGHLEIANTWQELTAEGFSFDSSNWNSLAVALVEDGQLERAFWISEFILCAPSVDEDGQSIERPSGVGGNLIKSTNTDIMKRLPSRLYQKREGERANQRRRPILIRKALNVREGEDLSSLELTSSIYESQEIIKSHTWFPHSKLLTALSRALYNLSLQGGRKIAKGHWNRHETNLAEEFEILLGEKEGEDLLIKLQEGHWKTMAAIRNWERAKRRRKESEENEE